MKSIKTICIVVVMGFWQFLTVRPVAAQNKNQLSDYAGKYTRNIRGYHAYLSVTIDSDKAVIKQWWDGKIRKLELLGYDRFIITPYGWAVQFTRNKAGKVTQMKVLENETWTKIADK